MISFNVPKRVFLFTLFLFACLTPVLHAFAADSFDQGQVLHLGPGAEQYSLTPYVQYFSDPSNQLKIEDIAELDRAGKFIPLSTSAISLGVTSDTLWFRFQLAGGPHSRLNNYSNGWLLDMDRPMEQKLTLYLPGTQGDWQMIEACSQTPCPAQTLLRMGVFYLPPMTSTPQAFFLRAEAQTAMLFFPKVLTLEAFSKKDSLRTLGQGLYFGLALAMIICNLSFFFFLKDKTFLWYVLYVFFTSLYLSVANGLSIRYVLFIDVPGLIHLDLISLGLMNLIAAQFTRSFLMTRENILWIDRLLIGYMALTFLLLLATLFVDIYSILPFFSLMGALSPLVTVVPAVLLLMRGFTPARFFLLGWFLFVVGILVFSLSYDNRIPANIWFFHGMQIGSAFEIICFSLALGHRVNVLRKEKEALVVSHRYYKKASMIDGLTGIFNRRYYEEKICLEVAAANRENYSLCLLVMDVDDFKRFNDTYGHHRGDQVLRQLGDILGSMARKQDASCRYGGEEFVLILPRTEGEQAYKIAERLRMEFNRQDFCVEENYVVQESVSIGVAILKPKENPDTFFTRADNALYQAKEQGKNRTVIAD